MRTLRICLHACVAAAALGAFTGCESSGGGSSASGSLYYGVGVYDPWYYGGYYNDVDVIVTPPGDRPRPEQPIARPLPSPSPRPLPAMPSAPRPMPRRR